MAKKLAKFDKNKHPRGYHGWFTETPDQPKVSKSRLGKARVYGTDNAQRKLSKRLSKSQEVKLDEMLLARASKRDISKADSPSANQLSKTRVYGSDIETRKLLLSRMSKAQKLRLLAAFEAADKQKVDEPTVAATEPSPSPTKAKRSKLTPEEKAAREAEKAKVKADKEAERARRQAEKEAAKAAREAEVASNAIAKDTKARKEIKETLEGERYAKVEPLKDGFGYAIKASDGKPTLPTAPTIRKPLKRSDVLVVDGKVEIWQGQENLAKHTGGFKVRKEKNFEYGVEYEGKPVVLNRSQTVMEFEGERIYGVVSDHTKLRDFDNQKVMDRLLKSMQYIEDFTDRKTKPPAIDWVETYHGKIDKDVLLLNGKDGKYGGVEIHHMDQWALTRFDEITGKLKYNKKTNSYEDGEITVEEAKRQMSDLVEWVHDKTPSGKWEWQWRIKLASQDQRKLVMLPAGAHNATSKKLYSLLHPPGVHPDTGKKAEFGIPIASNEYGRDWFNGWNARFWNEYYRREAYIMRRELNRRIASGDIKLEDIPDMTDISRAKQTRDHEWQVNENKVNKSKRKAIMVDFLEERTHWNGKYKE